MSLTLDHWEQIKALFESALALDPAGRRIFLDAHCPSPEIRREVESLLGSHDQTGQFLEEPAASLESFHTELALDTASIGMRIGPWELVQEIGRGGMGTVYLAVRADHEFRKRVALKLISHGMENEFAIRRFRNERQILAKLEHPNIARLIDGGTTPEGSPYFVMEFVEGEPLTRYCDAHSLGPAERIDIFLKVCSAVQYAHRRMIVHRDLKPGNILVKKDGTPKLLDFGIAKLLDSEVGEVADITITGARIVTPAYASPEQMRGEAATVQSDVYALGIVLFELLTGRRPAQDPTAFNHLDPGFRRVLTRATLHDQQDRYESVEAFAADIQRCLDGQPPTHLPDAKTVTGPSQGSVAVLPFRLLNADMSTDAYLGLGITDAVVTKLSNVGRISIRPTSAVMRYAEVADATIAGRELNVEFVVEGRVQRTGNRVRATVQLVRVRTGTPIWAGNFDEEIEDLLKVEDSISGQVAQALIPQLTGEEREQLARRGTTNAAAHQAYLRGRWNWSQYTEESLAKALVCFMQAIAEDPKYAHAHAGVADYYIQLGVWGGLPPHESFAAAKQSAKTALEIDPSLAEAHTSYGFSLWAYDRDDAAAAHEFQLAIALNPDYATAHYWYGLLNSARGRPEMAIACLDRARRLSPRSSILVAALGFVYYNARQFDRAAEILGDGLRTLGDTASISETTAWNFLAMGRIAECREAALRAADLSNRSTLYLAVLAHAEAASGNAVAARQVLTETELNARTRYVSGYAIGSMHLACGNRKEALASLARAWDDRDWWTLWLAIGPVWDPLRLEPQFSRFTSWAGHRVPANLPPVATRPKPSGSKAVFAACALLAVVAALVVFIRSRPVAAPFQKARIAKITTNGTARAAAISPDGKYVAYAASQSGKTSIWIRTLSSSSPSFLAGPFEGEIADLAFTRNGTHVAYIENGFNDATRAGLYAVPVTGGKPEMLIPSIDGPVRLSPDGTRIALLRANPARRIDELVIANATGGAPRVIATRKYPDRFSSTAVPAWSTDGKRIACAIEGTDAQGFRMNLMTFDVDTGASRVVPSPRWQYVGRAAWTNDQRGLFVIGQEVDGSFQQLWYVPFGRGESSRITNDLNDYLSISLSADGSSLVSVQKQTLTNVYVLDRGQTGQGTQITPGAGRYFDLAWSPDGNRIAYASDASGTADISIMNADGSSQRPLTSGVGRNYAPAFSPDGKTIAFHSNRSGNWNIWRMDTDGRNQLQLTSGTRDSNWPQFTPDGTSVVYHHTGLDAMFNIWRVPAAGGTPVQLSEKLTTYPAISPRDGRIACWFSDRVEKPAWRIAVLEPNGGSPTRVFDVGPTVDPDSFVRWNHTSDGITYVDNRGGVRNLWLQPVDGGPARPLTNFTSGLIFSFGWSGDGRLVYSRGMSTSDVVMSSTEGS